MTPHQPPYRTVDEVPAEGDEVEPFRAELGRTHRWAQALHRAHRAYGLIGAFLGRWRDRVRWSVDLVEAATFQAIDSLYDRRSTAWQVSGEATLPAPPAERRGQKGGHSRGVATTGAPSGGQGLTDELRLIAHRHQRIVRPSEEKKNATSNLVATAEGEGRERR